MALLVSECGQHPLTASQTPHVPQRAMIHSRMLTSIACGASLDVCDTSAMPHVPKV
jgi:hypothetical protein